MKDLELQKALLLGCYRELQEALILTMEFEAPKKVSQQLPKIYYMRAVQKRRGICDRMTVKEERDARKQRSI